MPFGGCSTSRCSRRLPVTGCCRHSGSGPNPSLPTCPRSNLDFTDRDAALAWWDANGQLTSSHVVCKLAVGPSLAQPVLQQLAVLLPGLLLPRAKLWDP